MEAYENLAIIGEGTYGIVFKCRHKSTGDLVAIKKFKEYDTDESVRKTAMREVRILKMLKHEHLVSLLEVFRRKGKLYLVFEFVERTLLEDLDCNPTGLPRETVACNMVQLLRAMEYLHSCQVIHRDIKPENILISSHGILKLCDMGFARPLGPPDAQYSDYVATRWYRAPELLVGDRGYGPAVDVWAFGCMLVEMATGAPLFPGDSDIDQLWRIMRCFGRLAPAHLAAMQANPAFDAIRAPAAHELQPLETRYPHLSLQMLQVLRACLHPEPHKRLTCQQLLGLPYFREAIRTFPMEVLKAQEQQREVVARRLQDAKMRRLKRKQQEMERVSGGASPVHHSHSTAGMGGAVDTGHHRLPPSLLRLQQEAAGENSLQSEASTASLGMADGAAAGSSAWSTSAAAGGAAPAPLGASRASSEERGLPRGEPMDQTPCMGSGHGVLAVAPLTWDAKQMLVSHGNSMDQDDGMGLIGTALAPQLSEDSCVEKQIGHGSSKGRRGQQHHQQHSHHQQARPAGDDADHIKAWRREASPSRAQDAYGAQQLQPLVGIALAGHPAAAPQQQQQQLQQLQQAPAAHGPRQHQQGLVPDGFWGTLASPSKPRLGGQQQAAQPMPIPAAHQQPHLHQQQQQQHQHAVVRQLQYHSPKQEGPLMMANFPELLSARVRSPLSRDYLQGGSAMGSRRHTPGQTPGMMSPAQHSPAGASPAVQSPARSNNASPARSHSHLRHPSALHSLQDLGHLAAEASLHFAGLQGAQLPQQGQDVQSLKASAAPSPRHGPIVSGKPPTSKRHRQRGQR